MVTCLVWLCHANVVMGYMGEMRSEVSTICQEM